MGLVNAVKEGGVAVLELNAPPANTYSYEMMRELDQHVLDARMDAGVHVVVVTGARHGKTEFFCAGADIKMLEKADPYFKYNFCLHANETLCRLEQTPKLVIAAINGHCVGGGLEIALACDLRIARRQAGKVGLPEVALGVLPGTGGTQRLARALGRAKAIELMAEGATVEVEEAKALGLVNAVLDVPADGFRAAALEYARSHHRPRGRARAGPGARARAAAAPVRGQGRGRRDRGLQRAAEAGVQRHLGHDVRAMKSAAPPTRAATGLRAGTRARPDRGGGPSGRGTRTVRLRSGTAPRGPPRSRAAARGARR